MDNKLRIAVGQIDVVPGAYGRNLEIHLDLIGQALEAGAKLIVFPELSLTGLPKSSDCHKHALSKETLEKSALAKASSKLDIAFGFLEEGENGEYYNSAAILSCGKVQCIHRKLNLVHYGMWDEKHWFNAGDTLSTCFEAHGQKFGLFICADFWNPALVHATASNEANILLCLSKSMYEGLGQRYCLVRAWQRMNRFYASIYGCYVVFANHVGINDQQQMPYWGGSEVVNPYGEVVVQATNYRTELVVAELDLSLVPEVRNLLPTIAENKAEIFLRKPKSVGLGLIAAQRGVKQKTTSMKEREVSFYSDGLRLSGTLYQAKNAEIKEPRPAIVIISGYQGFNSFYPRRFAEQLVGAGYACLGFDYRGFGSSAGTPGRVIVNEQVEDVKNAVRFLRTQDEVNSQKIAIIGWGMGAAHAVRVSADKNIAATVALNGFFHGERWLRTALGTTAWNGVLEALKDDQARRVLTGESLLVDAFLHYPLDPLTNEHVQFELAQTDGFGRQTTLEFTDSVLEMDVEDVAMKIAPKALFIAHGRHNKLHPLEESLSLFKKAKDPKELHLLEGGHNDFMYPEHEVFKSLIRKLKEFLERNLL